MIAMTMTAVKIAGVTIVRNSLLRKEDIALRISRPVGAVHQWLDYALPITEEYTAITTKTTY